MAPTSSDGNPLQRLTPPIVVVAPTQRCGTTLIQRALNSTKQAIIYGENFGAFEKIPSNLRAISQNFEMRVARTTACRSEIESGNYDQDLSALFPNYKRYRKIMEQNFYNILKFYNTETLQSGFDRWGFKNQVVDLKGFLHFIKLVPTATYIFVYRDISEVIKSHKARFPHTLKHPNDFAAYGARWAANYRALRAVSGRKCLHVEHASIADDAKSLAAKLESLCEIGPIDLNVFSKMVNVSPVIDSLSLDESRTHYRSPASLSEQEYRAVISTAGETAKEFGYRVSQS